jgi:hypothetical protein
MSRGGSISVSGEELLANTSQPPVEDLRAKLPGLVRLNIAEVSVDSAVRAAFNSDANRVMVRHEGVSANQKTTPNLDFVIPSGVTPGTTWNVIMDINSWGEVGEKREDNNNTLAPMYISRPAGLVCP